MTPKPLDFSRAQKRRKRRETDKTVAAGKVPQPATDVIVHWDGKTIVSIGNFVLVCGTCQGGLSFMPVRDEVVTEETPSSRLYCSTCQGCVPPAEATRKLAGASRVILKGYEALSPGSHPDAAILRLAQGKSDVPAMPSGLTDQFGQPIGPLGDDE